MKTRMSMKTFRELRESTKSSNETVYDEKIARHRVTVKQIKKKFIVFIDGDKLDEFNDQKSAVAAGKEFVKQYNKG